MDTIFSFIIAAFFRVKRVFGFVMNTGLNSVDLSLIASLEILFFLSLKISQIFFPNTLK